jgi:4-amino-4-deoxy-L-arabinose transferase-like glycosyltransferase
MGEIPGLFYFMLFLLGLHALTRNVINRNTDPKKTTLIVILTSLALGLCAVTKPVFIVALPAAGLTLLLYRKRLPVTPKTIAASVVVLLACAGIWLVTQFSLNDEFESVLQFYRNPYLIDNVGAIITTNLKRLVTEGTPLYVLGLYAAWTTSLALRLIKRSGDVSKRPKPAETCAWLFGVLILIAYLRTPGFYRYFFYANVVALFAFPAALENVIYRASSRFRSWNTKNVAQDLAVFILMALTAFQGYHLFTNAFINTTYTSTQTAQLEHYFNTEFEQWREPYVYDAPAIPPFLPTDNYSQWIEISGHGRFAVGIPLNEALAAQPDTIIANEKRWHNERATFIQYQEIAQIEHYIVAERISEEEPL